MRAERKRERGEDWEEKGKGLRAKRNRKRVRLGGKREESKS